MKKDSKILITGFQGMVGSNLVGDLHERGYNNLYATDKITHNLLYQNEVENLFEEAQPEYVFHIAAKVGGILSNDKYGGEYIFENLQMQCNVIECARLYGVKKLLFMGSSCIYPRNAPQPIKEEYLLCDYLEETNKGYAVAKIAGVLMCQMYYKQYGCKFISAMPMNLYGPGDNFHLTDSHVLPAMIRKFHDAKINNLDTVVLWGTGNAKREFLYVDDVCDALIFLMNNYDDHHHINIGTGEEIRIYDLAQIVREITNFKGAIMWDSNYPDGVPQRKFDLTRIHSLGWYAKTSLIRGIESTYEWFVKNYDIARK